MARNDRVRIRSPLPWKGRFRRFGEAPLVYRVEAAEAVAETVAAAADLAFQGDAAVAVLLSQKLLGRKVWTR